MLKKDELANPRSCLNKAAPTEPIFVLRAKDPRAAQAVRLWAAMSAGAHEKEKLAEAAQLADEMEKWLGSQPKAPQAIGQVTGGLDDVLLCRPVPTNY